jgi:hypothetical protein
MTGSLIISSLLIIGLVISAQETASAEAEKIEVFGFDDLLILNWQEVTPLGESGRLLINGENQGDFDMFAADSALDIVGGTVIVAYHINQDSTGNGRGQGPITILDSDGSIAWEGNWEGKWLDGMFEGDAVTQGSGRFDGMKLKFHGIEVAPLVYEFEGSILDPNSE